MNSDSDQTFKVAFSRYALDRKIPPGDAFWPTFNASFDNHELTCLSIADLVYRGHPFTTWHTHHWRNAANYQLGQHVGLDFDTEDSRSSLKTLQSDRFVAKYAAMIYTTPSHTPLHPKSRVVFLLDSPIHQAKNYALAASALLWLFGTADRQCKDPCRFFYGSKDCDVVYLENTLPLDVVKHLIEQYREAGQAEHRRVSHPDWKAPAEQQRVAEALSRIPPWGIDYDQWLSVLMAVHAEFGDAGLPMVEAWADGAPGEVARKWRTFKSEGNETGVVGIGTVFALAQGKR